MHGWFASLPFRLKVVFVVPGHVEDRTIFWIGRTRIEGLEAFAELVENPRIAYALTGRFNRLFVELQEPVCIGDGAFFFQNRGSGNEKAFRRDFRRICAFALPERRRFVFE